MQIGTQIERAEGNGKLVTVETNTCTHTNTRTYFGAVQYDGEPHLDFDERFTRKADAVRWFNTWRKLTA